MKRNFYNAIFFQIILLNVAKTEEDFTKCGINIFSNANFVIGPRNDPEKNPVGHWPWMASMGFIDKKAVWEHQCGATLISDRHFLTAAHCVDEKQIIRISDFNLLSDGDDRNAKNLEILQMYVHPDYDGKSAYFDIAILETKPIEFSKAILPICLPETSSEDIHKYDDRSVELIGWGSTESRGSSSNTLKRVSITILPNSLCNSSYMDASERKAIEIKEQVPQLFQNHLICAGSSIDGLSACSGDSGGPLMAKNHNKKQWIQIALVHGKIGTCEDPDYPASFVRLDDPKVFAFISSNTETYYTTSEAPTSTSNLKNFKDNDFTTQNSEKYLTTIETMTSLNSNKDRMVDSGFTKMLVTGGYGGVYSTEIIDLQSPNSTCQSLPGFHDRYDAAGGLLGNEIPIICGGYAEFADICSTFIDGNWTAHKLSVKRSYPAMTSSPFPNKPEGLFILGGEYDDSSQSTADFLTKDGVESVLTKFPNRISSHCLILLNSTTVMAIGGDQGEEFYYSKKTYLLNTNNPVWVEGPLLRIGRRYHSCGRIITDSRSISTTIIVVGGGNINIGDDERIYLSSTEILNENMNGWIEGPKLPFGIRDAQIVEEPGGGVILVGGESNANLRLNTLFKLSHAEDEWKELPRHLKEGRSNHVAFLVSDEIANCTESEK